MDFIFVKTKEIKQLENDINKCIKNIKHNTLLILIGSLLVYASLVFFITLIP